ncbi:YgfZ/GcvT domain-containing protein [Gordonia hankookensis]|uniref:Folate-binding protein YgfZ n=1 Tax=Gordonia hankookensis TaxID=589403 RepID=A0ABR7W9H7_9ACTN|nr:folate-binding protein YgfZ [Gordonia hankookensis]MBD1319413.1 folate-binding protein YgfZ [Gordonia hankookensis]
MTASRILTRYSTQGAVPGPPQDGDDDLVRVAWHYGDPLGEQRTAERSAAVVDRSDRAVIELPGADRLTWLHTISSQHVESLADRTSAENLSLDANGRVEEHFVMTDVDGVTWVDCEGRRGPILLDFLTKMVFWAKVEPAARPDMSVLTLIGPDILHGPIADLIDLTPDAPIYTAGDLPELHHEEEPLGFWRVMPPIGEGARLPVIDLVIPESAVEAWWTQLTDAGARMAGGWTHDALRVAALRPRHGVDTDDRTIPQEVNWIGGPDELGAVHLDKGCYRGQETVARVHNLGKAPRRLVLLHLDGSTDERPSTGDPVKAGGRVVGRIGTVVDHYELGPIALALVKRSVGPEVDLLVDGERPVSARIDPDSVRDDDRVQAGRAAIDRLRHGGVS